jgi:glucoamylase
MKSAVALESWLQTERRVCAERLAAAISATDLQRERPEFGQRVRPRPGSVLASPVIANWDPEPDYFFHWPRDSAAVMRAVVDLVALSSNRAEREFWQARFHQMVDFNLTIAQAARLRPASGDHQAATLDSCRRFLRPRGELRRLTGDRLLAEPRFNPDGTADFLRWSRPQLDGPALRALACLAWLAEGGTATAPLLELLQGDLQFTLRQAGRRSIGPWEEADELAHHYFVALVQWAALIHGRVFSVYNPARWHRAEQTLHRQLQGFWSPEAGAFRAVQGLPEGSVTAAAHATQPLDSACLLAINEADLPGAEHSVRDPRALATLDALAAAFDRALPLNRQRPSAAAPALGRSLRDRYFGGGAWYVTTLAAAAFCYRRALAGLDAPAPWLARGDAWLETVRWLTPVDGALCEQVDRDSGTPRSARHLSWSYAALISTDRLRQRAKAATPALNAAGGGC